MYHPGGIDYDGKSIWVPVAEYRPNSRAIIYRVDPQAMKATEVFRYGDHIGGIVHNTDDKTLHGVSWGSRRFYSWTLDGDGKVHQRQDAAGAPARRQTARTTSTTRTASISAAGAALCSGLNNYQTEEGRPASFRSAAWRSSTSPTDRAIFQVPVELWTPNAACR